MIAIRRPALLPRRAGRTSSSASSIDDCAVPANTDESVGSTRGLPEANAGSFGIAPRRPPIGPDGPRSAASSICLMSSVAHVAVARLPSGIGGAALRCGWGRSGGGGCVGGRRTTGAGFGGVACGGGDGACAGAGGGAVTVDLATAGAGATGGDVSICGGGGRAASVALIDGGLVGAPVGGVLVVFGGGGGLKLPVVRVSSASSGRIVPPAADDFAPSPSIVALTFPLGGSFVGLTERCARASSAMTKYCCSSPMSPRRFHVLPVREISDSRVTMPATIHCCSTASSRHCFCSPFSRRRSQLRSLSTAVGSVMSTWRVISSLGLSTESARGCSLRIGCFDDDGLLRSGGGAPTLVFARRRILNMCPQFVHLTVTPVGLSLASSSSYSVWHFSQRTSMDLR